MSTHGNQFVNVSVSAEGAPALGAWLRQWMRAEGLSMPDRNDPRDERATEMLLGGGDPYRHDLVEIHAGELEGYCCPDGYEGPRCRSCGELSPDDRADPWAYTEAWFKTGKPPLLICDLCGWSASADEWDLSGAAALGHVGIETDVLSDPDAFLARLNATGTGRWVFVYLHL